MIWAQPHISKIYEALGAIGDKRIELSASKNEAKIYSSSKDKFYNVTWNDDLSEIMSNDNSAFFAGKLSYPMIAILMIKGKVDYDKSLPKILKGIKWKELNTKFKNNYEQSNRLCS